MATDKTQLANLALSHLGGKTTIADVATEVSAEATVFNLWYDTALSFVLGAADWNFARKRKALVLSAVAPPEPEWAFRYDTPPDYVKARYIVNPIGRKHPRVPFDILDDDTGIATIVTNAEDAELVYTRLVTTTTLFTSEFDLVFSLWLAHLMAGPQTGKRNTKQDMLNLYAQALGNANGVDGNEVEFGEAPEAEWITARS